MPSKSQVLKEIILISAVVVLSGCYHNKPSTIILYPPPPDSIEAIPHGHGCGSFAYNGAFPYKAVYQNDKGDFVTLVVIKVFQLDSKAVPPSDEHEPLKLSFQKDGSFLLPSWVSKWHETSYWNINNRRWERESNKDIYLLFRSPGCVDHVVLFEKSSFLQIVVLDCYSTSEAFKSLISHGN